MVEVVAVDRRRGGRVDGQEEVGVATVDEVDERGPGIEAVKVPDRPDRVGAVPAVVGLQVARGAQQRGTGLRVACGASVA